MIKRWDWKKEKVKKKWESDKHNNNCYSLCLWFIILLS